MYYLLNIHSGRIIGSYKNFLSALINKYKTLDKSVRSVWKVVKCNFKIYK